MASTTYASHSPHSPHSTTHTRPARPSDTFRPRGRLPLDPFAAPAHAHASSYSYHNAAYGGNAHASSSSSAASSPSRMNPNPHPHPGGGHYGYANPQRRDSGSSTGSTSEYQSQHQNQHQQYQQYAEQGAVWRVPKALVYGYGHGFGGRAPGGGRGQVVLVLGDPPAAELLPLLASPHLADPTAALVLIATHSPPGYLHDRPAHPSANLGPGPGRGPTIRILRLAEPLDAHQGGALRLVSLFERAARVVDAWRADVACGYQKEKGSVKEKARRASTIGGAGERILQLAEDAAGEFVCVEAYRPTPTRSASAANSGTRPRYPPSPSSDGPHGVEQEKERKKRFRFSLGMGSGPPSGSGTDSPRPLMESRMPSSPPTSSSSSTLSKAPPSPRVLRSPAPAPASPYAPASRRLSQSSASFLGATTTTASSKTPVASSDGRTFDAIVNFLPAHAQDKALLKHAILVSTLGAQYLGVGGGQVAASSGMPGQGMAAPAATTATVSAAEERHEGGGKLKKRPSRRLSMTQRLSGFFGLGGGAAAEEKALKELRELGEKEDRDTGKLKQKGKAPATATSVHASTGLSVFGTTAAPLHAHVVHILPPNMGNAQERPHGHKLVQSIEQFLLNFAYPLGSMLGGAGAGSARNSAFGGYGYAGSSGSLSSLSSLGSAGVQMNHMGANMGTHSGLSSATSSRNSSSSSLSGMVGNAPHAHAGSSQTLSQSQSAGQAQAQPRSRSLFSIGSPNGSRPASYFDAKDGDNGAAAMQKAYKPTTPPSAYPTPHMQRQRVRSTGNSASPHRPSSMYSTSTYTNSGRGTGGMLGGSGGLAQLAAQMAGRPVPYLVAPGVFGAPIGPVGTVGARIGVHGGGGARRMTYGEAMLLGVLDWDSAVEGGVGAGVRGAGRAYVAWGDVVCDGEIDGEDAVEDESTESTGLSAATGPAATLKKHATETTPRPAPTTTQLPTPPDSSVGSAESSVEGGDAESEAASMADRRRDLDKTPRFSNTTRFTRSPSSSARSSGSSAASSTQASPTAEAASLTSFLNDPLVRLPRTVEATAGSAHGTEANGQSAAGKDRGTETDKVAIIAKPLSPALNTSPSTATPAGPPSPQFKRRNHRPAPPPPSTPSPLMSFMVAEAQGNGNQTKTVALPEMTRNDPLRTSVCGTPTVPPALTNALGGVEMNRSHDLSQSRESDAPFFSAVSSAPAAEPPMMITLTSATVASVHPTQSQSGAIPPPPVTTNSLDSGYGSTESAGAREAHAKPLSHKAARPLHVSSTANPDLPAETQKAVQDAVARLVGETEADTVVDGRLSRRRSSSLKRSASKRSKSQTRSPVSSKAASPVVPQQPDAQQSPAGNAKAVGKNVSTDVGENGKLQGAWRKFGSWRRNSASLPAVDAGASPSA